MIYFLNFNENNFTVIYFYKKSNYLEAVIRN